MLIIGFSYTPCIFCGAWSTFSIGMGSASIGWMLHGTTFPLEKSKLKFQTLQGVKINSRRSNSIEGNRIELLHVKCHEGELINFSEHHHHPVGEGNSESS